MMNERDNVVIDKVTIDSLYVSDKMVITCLVNIFLVSHILLLFHSK